jgi:chemotaxis protein MotB
LLVIVPEGLLEFDVNESTIPLPGQSFLQEFTPKLMQTTCSSRFHDQIDSIVIEGHTDSTGGEAINLPLSQERSMEVVKQSLTILESATSENTTTLRECFLGFVSASGRGSANPILEVNGTEDFARSRRVIYRIRLRSIEQRQQFETNILLQTPGQRQ